MKKRDYNDGCATAHALEIIGERWTLLVIRELMLGPKRFSDLRSGLPGISANVLTQRLESLEHTSILKRRRLPPPAASQVYELTEWGLEAEDIIKGIGRWAARSPQLIGGKPMSVNSVILSFRTMFNSERAQDMNIETTYGFQFGEAEFLAVVEKGTLNIDHGEAHTAETIFRCDQNTLVAAVYGGVPLQVLIDNGDILITGKQSEAEAFCRLFPLPDSAPDTRPESKLT